MQGTLSKYKKTWDQFSAHGKEPRDQFPSRRSTPHKSIINWKILLFLWMVCQEMPYFSGNLTFPADIIISIICDRNPFIPSSKNMAGKPIRITWFFWQLLRQWARRAQFMVVDAVLRRLLHVDFKFYQCFILWLENIFKNFYFIYFKLIYFWYFQIILIC
jgi:hypothetical protein